MNKDIELLREAIKVSRDAKLEGNHPFGALLVDGEGNVILTAHNSYKEDKGVGHAETNLARKAVKLYEPGFLASCTLVTPLEPCCMCAGTIYWAGIGSLLYGTPEKRLAELTGDNPENLTMNLSCHEVFAAGQRKVEVRGPYPELENEIVADHIGFW
ncbi:nucleoside deaminase [Mesorhizobium sp. SP-1A]|uniref:nucleoside deaminase n=1 Tax=Mesorhizobium sp. SP-1A TaxID=3077840 RepID=UPI0028F7232E|nr:nucleoside deaminase [Mesorhizobium sp. SP-1A]